jgi:hypothetical protein
LGLRIVDFVGQSFRDANFDAEVGDGGQSTARGRSLHIYQFMKKVTGKYIISLARYALDMISHNSPGLFLTADAREACSMRK